MDRILFGDNQFFGINHMSEEKARAQALRFQEIGAVIDVLDFARSVGVNTFMCTTHDRVAQVCDHVRANPEKYAGFQFFPGMPYAHKYADAVTEYGITGAFKKFIPSGILSTVARGGSALATQDYTGIMKLLIDAEMKMFAGLRVEVVFLQNILTDLLLGLGMRDVFAAFHRYVRERYRAEGAFITMNLPRLLPVLEQAGIDNPMVCSSINKIGFRMPGGREQYEEVIQECRFRPIAMMVLAAGAIPPEEAIEYVCSLPRIESIVFGASSRSHITQTVELIRKYTRNEPRS